MIFCWNAGRELWGEGFGITDILRTQRSVERMPLTKEEAEKTYDCWQQGDTYREYNPKVIGYFLSRRNEVCAEQCVLSVCHSGKGDECES